MTRFSRRVALPLMLLGMAGCPGTASDLPGPQAETTVATSAPAPARPQPRPFPLERALADTTGGGEETTTGAADEGTTGDAEMDDPFARPEPPEDYGQIVFPDAPPVDDALTLHGLAGYEVVVVYARPDMSGPKLGFLRFGQRMRVTERLSREGCKQGWYGLQGGGYACASKGLVVGAKPPYMHKPPPPPKLDAPNPYDWAYVRKWNAAMWWRTPSSDERARAGVLREAREAARTGIPAQPEAATPADKGVTASSDGGTAAKSPSPAAAKKEKQEENAKNGAAPADLSKLPAPPSDDAAKSPGEAAGATETAAAAKGGDSGGENGAAPKAEGTPAAKEDGGAPAKDTDTPPPDAEPPAPPSSAATSTTADEGAPDVAGDAPEAEPPPPLPLARNHPWLEKGFFISLAEKFEAPDGARFWYTARGAYVAAEDAAPYKAKDFKGVELEPGQTFPVGFVMKRKGTKTYRMDDAGQLKAVGTLEKRDFVKLTEQADIKGRAYMVTEDGLFIRASHLRMPRLQPVPDGLEPYDRWIDVSLSDQILVAYEGSHPVYVTLVSTGREGSEEEPFETPTGRWRIRSKMVTSNMDGATATDGNYAIQDVPWVMYFEGSYALHGAFWHRSFGHVRSHGCVNLGPSDAQWLFGWTSPTLPDGWHGVHSSRDSPGTTVVIHE